MTNKKYFLLIPLFIAITLLYAFISHKLGINSDSASSILIAKDGANGNFLLTGWYLSTQAYYFTDIFWMTLLFKIFGYNLITPHLFAGFLYASLVFLSLKLTGKNTILGTGIIFGVIILPSIYQSFSTLVINIHVGTYVCALLCMIMTIKSIQNKNCKHIIFIVLISMPVTYSDSMYLYVFLFPLIISSIVARFMGVANNKTLLYAFLISVLVIIGTKIFAIIMGSTYEFTLPSPESINNPKFQQENLFSNNFSFFLGGMTDYFNAKFYGHEIKSIMGMVTFFNFIAMSTFSMLVVYCSIKSLKKDFASIFLASSSLLITSSYILSDLATDSASARYLFFALVTGSILIGRTLKVQCKFKYLLTFIFILSGLLKVITLKGDIYDPQYKQLNSYLHSLGLTKGYASFWNASSLTVMGDVNIAPVAFWKGANNMKWLSNDRWYNEDRNFIIYDTELDYVNGLKQLGPPTKTIEYNNKKIAIYKKINL